MKTANYAYNSCIMFNYSARIMWLISIKKTIYILIMQFNFFWDTTNPLVLLSPPKRFLWSMIEHLTPQEAWVYCPIRCLEAHEHDDISRKHKEKYNSNQISNLSSHVFPHLKTCDSFNPSISTPNGA